MNFIAELKRRHVIRMAGLYLVGAWLIVQVGQIGAIGRHVLPERLLALASG